MNDPIGAGATVTLTTVITNVSGLGGLSAESLAPASETSGTLYAQVDSGGSVGEQNNANNIYAAGTQICVASADMYEGDDTVATAKPIALGQTQTHNFSSSGDQDWVLFTADAGITYTVSTSSLSLSSDTYLYLYGPDGTTLLASNDDYGSSLASRITWTAQLSGTYYMLVKHWNPNVEGCGTGYSLSVGIGTGSSTIFLPLVMKTP